MPKTKLLQQKSSLSNKDKVIRLSTKLLPQEWQQGFDLAQSVINFPLPPIPYKILTQYHLNAFKYGAERVGLNWIFILNWVYKIRWNWKHQITSCPEYDYLFFEEGHLYASILNFCVEATLFNRNLGYPQDIFGKFILEIRKAELNGIASQIWFNKHVNKTNYLKCLRNQLKTLQLNKNPFDKQTYPYYSAVIDTWLLLNKSGQAGNLFELWLGDCLDGKLTKKKPDNKPRAYLEAFSAYIQSIEKSTTSIGNCKEDGIYYHPKRGKYNVLA